MKEYEVIRELFNSCSNKFHLDSTFDDLVECEDIIQFFTELFEGELPPYTTQTEGESTIYTFQLPLPQRYTVTEM